MWRITAAMATFQTHLWCYLWDLVDEGIDGVLDRLQGEAGVTGISVATNYHRVDQLRPHASDGPRRFISAGGAQFQPHGACYASTRMRPVVAQWLRKTNPLAVVAEACAKRGLTLRGWHVCCHGSAMVERYPAGAVKDVFGAVSPAWLCPSNLDVRECLRGMVEDLGTHYGFEAIELERASFPTDLHAHHHEKEGFACGPAGDWLRGLCFCESCRQLAAREGADVAEAAKVATRYLEGVLASGEPLATEPGELLDREPALAAYADWRRGQVTSLVKLIRTTCPCRLIVHRSGPPLWGATDFAALAATCDALLAPCYVNDPQRLATAVRAAAADTGDVARVEVGLSACTPPCSEAADLVAMMRSAVEQGVRSANIYNYGLLPLPRLEWIRQACRYASREAR